MVCLITRLYDVDSGTITIDGVDVRQISSMKLRRQVGMVPQEPFLFEGTIASNIAYGDPDASPERIIASAKAASAHDFILRMPFSYETLLGERGAGLSGGERQRISIARAILYDPKILILDEATSSIDTESERLIQRAVERFSRGRTMLAIAHRLSTLESVDRLIVLDQGKLVEQGSHRELLSAGGVYSRLTRLQFGSAHEESSIAVAVAEEPSAETGVDGKSSTESRSDTRTDDDPALEWEVRWFIPQTANFYPGPHDVLTLKWADQEFPGVYTVRSFPASYSEEFLSIRFAGTDGRDRELGMIRRLEEWPAQTQDLIRRSLNRRYLLRTITSIVSFREDNGFISCSVETEEGPIDFLVHNNSHSVKKFGYNGVLLTDLDQNHYLIHDLEMLSFLQRRLFRQLFNDF